MTLANTIASSPSSSPGPSPLSSALAARSTSPPDNTLLAKALLDSGKMREFVEALALVSRMLLKLNQEEQQKEHAAELTASLQGRPKRRSARRRSLKKRGWMGETLDLWDVTRVAD
jgi:hypothetical protein